jgi:hypothetical protein
MTAPASQDQFDAMLSRGVLFSILWLMGFGSVYPFLCGLRARRMIRGSSGALTGLGKTWWCLIVGGVGMIIWFPLIAVGIINNLR